MRSTASKLATAGVAVGLAALSALPPPPSALAAPLPPPPSTTTSTTADELWARASSSVTSDLAAAAGRTYDYVVVGCGLGGLTVASRLSEDPALRVICIEAGQDTRRDPTVTNMGKYGAALWDGSHTYGDVTVAQEALGGATRPVMAGRGLGGSTSVNGGAWTRASAAQYDALGELAGDSPPSLSAAALWPYMTKAERFVAPTPRQVELGAAWNATAHGDRGPVQVAFPDGIYSGPQQVSFVRAAHQAFGTPVVDDLAAGFAGSGAALTPLTVLAGSGDAMTRVSAATAYLSPGVESQRPNLTVLVGATAVRATWADADDGEPARAMGVVVRQSRDAPDVSICAEREVIVSAGTLRTPAFLERSGVGGAPTLRRLGVAQKVELPGVGLGLSEQTKLYMGGAPRRVDFGGPGPSGAVAYVSLPELVANATDVARHVEESIPGWAQAAVDAGAFASVDGLVRLYRAQSAGLARGSWPAVEYLAVSTPESLNLDLWSLNPFSRGTVHARSASAFDAPLVDPRYFSVGFDLDQMVAALRGARRLLRQQALLGDGVVGAETVPGFDESRGGVADDADAGGYASWRRRLLEGDGKGGGAFDSVWHPIGTAGMLPRGDGGVVSPDFKVHGTANVRVVDASVLVVQAAHLSSTLYGLAEKAAETILRGA